MRRCLLADGLQRAEYGDGLSHKQSRLMNKTSEQVVVECLSRRVGMLTDRRAQRVCSPPPKVGSLNLSSLVSQ